MDWQGFAVALSAIGTIVAAFLSYNQYTKNKTTDLKIEKFKKEEEAKSKRRNDSSAIVFGELWKALYSLKADRVYIVQPHPLGNECLLSVFFEVKRKGVEGMRSHVQEIRMSDMAKFCSDLAKNLFMYIDDVDSDVEDRYAKSLLSSYGCTAAVIKRMNDNRHDWVGSIFCEFTHKMSVPEDEARRVLHEAAMNIQYILPEYK